MFPIFPTYQDNLWHSKSQGATTCNVSQFGHASNLFVLRKFKFRRIRRVALGAPCNSSQGKKQTDFPSFQRLCPKKQSEPESSKDKPGTGNPIFNVRLMSCVRFVIWPNSSTHANLDSIQKILPLSLLFPDLLSHTLSGPMIGSHFLPKAGQSIWRQFFPHLSGEGC